MDLSKFQAFLNTHERQKLRSVVFEKHQNQPDVTLEEYIQKKNLELWSQMQNIKRIYLDTNYWIYLRDVLMERLKDAKYKHFFELISSLVRKGKIICPIGENVFMELLKQSDKKTRLATSQVIDQLSKGVALQPSLERSISEIFCSIQNIKSDPSSSLHQIVWTKIVYVLGIDHPVDNRLSEEQMLFVQKSFVDLMWTVSLNEMVEILEFPPTQSEFGDLIPYLNRGKFKYESDIENFEQLYLSELSGILDIYFERQKIKDSDGKSPRELIYATFKRNRHCTLFSFLNIQAGIHSYMRWDRKREYDLNDIHDFGHAAAALPYYDYFLTDNALRHLLTCRKLGFDKLYKTTVIGNINEAIEALTGLEYG